MNRIIIKVANIAIDIAIGAWMIFLIAVFIKIIVLDYL